MTALQHKRHCHRDGNDADKNQAVALGFGWVAGIEPLRPDDGKIHQQRHDDDGDGFGKNRHDGLKHGRYFVAEAQG